MFAHYVRVIHSLCSWGMLPLVASFSFAVVCSRCSRQTFAVLMGNAPCGRVSHSHSLMGNAPFGRVSHSHSLMGNAPFGRVIQLRCYLLTVFASFIRCAYGGNTPFGRVIHSLRLWGKCSLWSRQSFAFAHGEMLTLFVSVIRIRSWGNAPFGSVIQLRSWGNAPLGRVSHSLRSWGNTPLGRVIHSLLFSQS